MRRTPRAQVAGAIRPGSAKLPGRLGLERQWLHAVRLSFAHPDDGRWVSFESPYAPDLQRALDRVREPTWV